MKEDSTELGSGVARLKLLKFLSTDAVTLKINISMHDFRGMQTFSWEQWGEFSVRHGYSSYEHVEQVLVQPRTETDFHFLDHSVCLKDHVSSTMDSLRYILTWNTHMLPLYGHSTSLPTHHCCKICVLNFLILCLLGLWPNSWVIHCPSVSINTYLRPHFSQHNSSYLNTHQKDLQSTLFFKNYS